MATPTEKAVTAAEKALTAATSKVVGANAMAKAAKDAAKLAATAAAAKGASAAIKKAAKSATEKGTTAAETAATAKAEVATAKDVVKAAKAANKAALKVVKDEAKAKSDKEKADAKAAKLLPVVLTDAQNDLAATVNSNQEIIINSGNSMIMTAMESGKILTKLKDAVKKAKGDWMPWQKKNLVLSNRQCSKYVKLASDPEEVKKLLKEMGEEASINAICGAIGQKALTNDEIKERDDKKAATAAAKAEANVMDINDERIDAAVAKCANIEDLEGLIETLQDRIAEIKAAPAPAEEDDDDGIDDDDDGEDGIGDLADIADHAPQANPLD